MRSQQEISLLELCLYSAKPSGAQNRPQRFGGEGKKQLDTLLTGKRMGVSDERQTRKLIGKAVVVLPGRSLAIFFQKKERLTLASDDRCATRNHLDGNDGVATDRTRSIKSEYVVRIAERV